MKIISPSRKSSGFALMILLCCLIVMITAFASVMYWISTNGKQMKKNELFTDSEAAAEGETEVIFAHMDRDYLYQTMNSSGSYYAAWLPHTNNWPTLYSFSNSVIMGVQNKNLNYLGSQYTNLLGFPQTNIVTVTATPIGKTFSVPATISQTFVFASIPAFQFAIFYNIDLEIDPGEEMPITGAVFSNGSIWSGSPLVTYSSTVEAAGQVNTNGTDPFMSGKTDSGTPLANFLFPGPPQQPESGVNPLVIPIGASGAGSQNSSTNVEAIINIPPPGACAPLAVAYQPTNQTYNFNAASLIVSNWYWGSNTVAPWSNNFTVYLQDSALHPSSAGANWVMLTNDYYIVSNRYGSSAGSYHLYPTNFVPRFMFTDNVSALCWTNNPAGTNTVWYAGFSFLTNVTFYDFREQATVQAVQLDVGSLNTWITATTTNGGAAWSQDLCQDIGHGINSVFIYNAVPFIGQQQLPAVRVMDGTLLPNSVNVVNGTNCYTSGLTVVTPQPMYVWGNYNVQTNGGPVVLDSTNTVNTYPAAFMADSITVLSSNWSDANPPGQPTSSRTPVNTTINAACLEGIVPSYGLNYSGGVENFLRLLEDWTSSIQLTYNGSIMVMFPSQYATNIWSGSYYSVPERVWSFDTNFLIQADLPPLTPQFRGVIRNSWAGY
jgi:hypothetical protein